MESIELVLDGQDFWGLNLRHSHIALLGCLPSVLWMVESELARGLVLADKLSDLLFYHVQALGLLKDSGNLERVKEVALRELAPLKFFCAL